METKFCDGKISNWFAFLIYYSNFVLRTYLIMKDSFIVKASAIFCVSANNSFQIILFCISKGKNP